VEESITNGFKSNHLLQRILTVLSDRPHTVTYIAKALKESDIVIRIKLRVLATQGVIQREKISFGGRQIEIFSLPSQAMPPVQSLV